MLDRRYLLLGTIPLALAGPSAALAQWPSDDATPTEFSLAINA